jgi:flagellar biosynthesis protein FlhF
MQVKKFEAPTIQEALDHVKRELGPEAIILQTKKNRRGFGLLSKSSVEVTAAVSERSIQKKQYVENRVAEPSREALKKLPAQKQADLLDKYVDQRLSKAAETHDRVEMGNRAKKITATRYADIGDDGESVERPMERKQPVRRPLTNSLREEAEQSRAARPAGRASYAQNEPSAGPSSSDEVIPEPSRSQVITDSKRVESPLEEEVRLLRQIVQELKNSQESAKATGANRIWDAGTIDHPVLQESFEKLVLNGIDRRYAYALVKKVAFELGPERCGNPETLADALANEMIETIEVSSIAAMKKAPEAGLSPYPLTLAVVGPTGCGKTSTVAKIASDARAKKNMKVGLINLDTSKLYEFGQLGTYAKALNLPFRSVRSLDDLRAAMDDFKSMDLILVDTPGRSYLDQASLAEIQTILSGVKNLKVSLLLNAGTRDSELLDCISRFSFFKPQSLTFSKLDETKIYGSIYNVFQKTKLPFLFFTTGQKVPEDLEEATPERVVSLVLRI